ncbi:signal peptide peptidase SppA [Metabacillus litoralis]|uniref:signal peptide peptidase SppA n=1 Tax=Metabacillus TaxID=2675233 RepID=UPI000EF5A509|nr:signal peptide peptidase SppA [Metabacillus litoralis]MCM3162824.1 signal peptide peptidase SppA [Metabacillus litoralis]MCM3410990.1 signal peptide peptidase SppA [Metabacillus litoralis]UHA62216.1 signal peptide peptidase SppA [Metabacillus litoralis]
MNGKRWGALAIAAVLFVFSIIISSTMMFLNQSEMFAEAFSTGSEFSEEVIDEGSEFSKILVLNVNGVIQDTGEDVTSFFSTAGYKHQTFLDMIEAAGEDNTIKGVILRVNSPGGGVVESAEIHKKLLELKETSKKPLYVSMGTQAASGGYYISTAGDKIFAAPDTLTGSLGVIMQSINYGGLAEKYGVKFETIKSGPYKDIFSPTREMTEDERNILQSMVDNAYAGFVDVITEGRPLSEDQVRKVADGRIYDGRQAKEIKLIDELGYFDDTVEAMKKDLKIKDAQVIQYGTALGFESLLSMTASKVFREDIELSNLYQLLSNTNSPRLMYLYSE